jgi:hypothetical protein
LVRNTAQVRPRQASQKYSKEEKLIAISAKARRRGDQHRDPDQPAGDREDQVHPHVQLSWPFFIIS